MPKFGQMTEESAIVEWRKKPGDRVARGDILFTVETDKSVMDVESFEEGTLLKIAVGPGVNVPVQSIVGYLGQPGETAPEAPTPASSPPARRPDGQASLPKPPAQTTVMNREAARVAEATPSAPTVAATSSPALPPRFRISPRAAALARASVINPAGIRGSGPGGRIIEKDVQTHLAAQGYGQLLISPAAKRLASQEELDVLGLHGTGDSGRIMVEDVQRAVAEKPKPLNKMRQVIAQRLTQSFRDTPHFYLTVSVDMTDLIGYRSRLKEAGAPYTVTDFIAQAVVLTLQEVPEVNSSTDGRTLRWHSHVNLGLAVSLEQGLVVPVIHGAEQLSLRELCERSKELVQKARAGKATPDDLSGGTFTISNMGMLDVENFGAIINPGESAILAVSSTLAQPVVREGKIVVRQMLKLTLSCDHRIVDGALGARFANGVRKKLQDLALWKLLAGG